MSVAEKMSMDKENTQSTTEEKNMLTNSRDSSSVNSIQDTTAKSGNDCFSVPSKEAKVEKHKTDNPRRKILFTRSDGRSFLSTVPSIKEILDNVTKSSECLKGRTKRLKLREFKDKDKRPFDNFTLHVSEDKYADLKKCHCSVKMAIILANEKIDLSHKMLTNFGLCSSLFKKECRLHLLEELLKSLNDQSDCGKNDRSQLQVLADSIIKAMARKYYGTFPVPLPMRNSTPPIGPIRCRLKVRPNCTPGIYPQQRLHLGNAIPYPRKERLHYWRKSSKKAASRATVWNGFPHQARPEVEANVFEDSDTATAMPHCSNQLVLQKGSQSLQKFKHKIPPSSICVPAEISSSKESSERPLFATNLMTFEDLVRPMPNLLIFDLDLVSWKRDLYVG